MRSFRPLYPGGFLAAAIGGGTAVIQGAVMLLLAGVVGVPYSPTLLPTLLGEMMLVAVA